MSPVIHSKRLALISMTPAFLRASLERKNREAEMLIGLSLPADWPEPDALNLLSMRLRQLEEYAAFQAWSLRAMPLPQERKLVGTIGFHTVPGADYLKAFCPDAVEFGFSVLPPFRRRGFAREASLALMSWAHQTHGVTKFIVSIRPDNIASQALASQLGFQRIGSHVDDVDGLEDVLLRDVAGQMRLA